MSERRRKFWPFRKKQNTIIKVNDVKNMSSAQLASYLARHEAAATDSAIAGMDLFREAAQKLAKVDIGKKQGNLFEYIEATKFNMDAARKGALDTKAFVTAAEGDPHAAADIIIKKGNKVVEEIQAKSSNSSVEATYMISDEKYRGMQKLVNSDKEEAVRNLATKRSNMGTHKQEDYIDTARNVTGGAHHGDIRSDGTSYDEVIGAAENPERYANQLEMKQFKQEITTTATQAAVVGGVIGGAISLVQNSIQVSQGKLDAKDAGMNVVKNTAKSSVKSGATGALGSTIRIGAQKAEISALAKGNVATSIAAGVIDCGVTIYSLAKGEIKAEEAMERMGQTAFSTSSSIYAGLVAGVAFGPGIIATMGSLAGYMLATHVYQSCIAIFKSAKLAEDEAERVIALLNEAIREMQTQRELFEKNVKEHLQSQRKMFQKCFNDIEIGLETGNPVQVINVLEQFTATFGKQLKLTNFEEFDRYMKKNDTLHL
ncbi:hypothetical protein EJF36_19055 [Bacillus sp. HMF5848]|uniref:hypothetical protein n=1 Tax=Bacillus sp. HMF5848 TaxID=2495421 RepID=UPI000F7AD18C|nr:hypothetical protein [Bacillus sp. HMF5848]RSK28804.1 hypothetical protein EJF36_19055 [Bacillus sp. HMF5848]